MKETCDNQRETEHGIALITTLLCTTMLLALGMAVVLSATTDTVTTKVQRVGEQSFFVADAGIGIARQALTLALTQEMEAIQAQIGAGESPFYRYTPNTTNPTFPPDVQVLPEPLPNHEWSEQPAFYQRVKARADALVRHQARVDRFDVLNGGSFEVEFKPFTGDVAVNPWFANTTQEVERLHYAIQVKGKTAAGGSATVNEVGILTAHFALQFGPPSGGNRDFSFSGFGAFFDVGDDPAHLNYVLVPGTFSGPVHTNSHFAFYTGWQYTFRDKISQFDDNFRVYYNTFVPVANVGNYSGSIHLSASGYQKTGRVALPTNGFSQEYAVINGTGIRDVNSATGLPVDPPGVITTDGSGNPNIFDGSGRVTAAALAANLRTAANVSPTVSGGVLANGVYISSSNGTSIDGAGIYVQGDAADIQLYGDTNGDQVYVIQQGTTTTTIRSNFENNTTTVSSGASSTTYTGVPTDRSDPQHSRPGASLFVNGGVTSLHGGVDSTHPTRPAIASKSAVTITAQRSIKVTGDLKYADSVVNADGTPVSNIAAVKNVLGLFTNDGNIYLDAKTAYSANSDLSIEIDAANCVFDSNTSNNNEAPYTGQEGGITTWFGSGHQTPSSSARIKLIGSDVEKNNSLVDYYNGDTFFDVRFSGGGFRPPFFPGTTYALGPPPVASVLTVASMADTKSTARSWFRDNN